jgi:hypothetical protein
VRAIADAVLYEGYVLWPYRRGALKNQQRFTFGGVYPPAHPDDRSVMRAEVLIEGDPAVDVRVRFLHVVRRQPMRDGVPVDELEAGGQRHLAWDEAVERELGPGPFELPAGRAVEDVPGGQVVRTWEALRGQVTVDARPPHVVVEVHNDTGWEGGPREELLRRTLCSTHVVLRATAGGAFVSLTDPPETWRAAAAACRNDGCWPVLVGPPGSRDAMLAAPIIVEDHPRVAPESPGDLFDGGEIDQMLVLNILAMTPQERADMRDADPRTRAILERTERLTEAQMLQLSTGAIREFGMLR